MTTAFIHRPTAPWRLSIGMVAILGLTACDETGQFALPNLGGDTATQASATPAASNSTELVERDVQAPNVLQVTEIGRWDGRPALDAVLVAHPYAVDPECVTHCNAVTV